MTGRHVDRLVARASRGDANAFAGLYDHYADRVYGFVKMRLRDARDAEEVAETVFLKAWQALPGYQQRSLPFSAWLFRIARNSVVDAVRRSGREPIVADVAEAEELECGVRVDDAAFARLDAERVREAIAGLTEEQAAVVTMRFLWDLSLKDTAAALERTEGAVKALQHRALRTLARVLSEERIDETA